MIRALIIDDEKDAVDGLSLLLKPFSHKIKVEASANSAAEGISLIQLLQPDLVFLDVEMPYGSGFDVLEKLPQRNFKTIFTTAYNHYAVKAIKFSAFDYLLKPVDADELGAAINRVEQSSNLQQAEKRSVLLENIKGNTLTKIAVPIKDGFQYIALKDIIRIEGEGSYCIFKMVNGEKLIVSHNLGVYDELLCKNSFYRVHQSHMINLEHIFQYVRTDGGMVIMSDKSMVPVSRRNREGFLNAVRIN